MWHRVGRFQFRLIKDFIKIHLWPLMLTQRGGQTMFSYFFPMAKTDFFLPKGGHCPPKYTSCRFLDIQVSAHSPMLCDFVPGYRHVPLRSMSNQPLELSTLFIYSYLDEDAHVDSSPSADLQHTNDDKPDGRKAVRGVLVRSRDVGGKQEREVTYLPRFYHALFVQFMLFFFCLYICMLHFI